MSWLYILTVCIRVSSSFSFFANILISSLYIRWLIFSCNLLSFHPAMHVLSMWLNGIMGIMNSKCYSAPPWKIPLWIFVSAKLLPPAVRCTLQVSWSFRWSLTSCDILSISSILSSFGGIYHMLFCGLSRPWLDFSVLSYSHLRCVDLWSFAPDFLFFREQSAAW